MQYLGAFIGDVVARQVKGCDSGVTGKRFIQLQHQLHLSDLHEDISRDHHMCQPQLMKQSSLLHPSASPAAGSHRGYAGIVDVTGAQ